MSFQSYATFSMVQKVYILDPIDFHCMDKNSSTTFFKISYFEENG